MPSGRAAVVGARERDTALKRSVRAQYRCGSMASTRLARPIPVAAGVSRTQLERRKRRNAVAAGDVGRCRFLRYRARHGALEDRLAQMLDAEHAYADARAEVRQLTFLAKLADDLDELVASLEP
jgi:hypothetical protein